MTLEFELRRPSHAIAEFAASIDLFSPVSQNTFTNVVAKLKNEAGRLGLPAETPLGPVSLPVAYAQIPRPPVFMGSGFQRFAPTGEVSASLLCEPNAITFTRRDYTTWQEIKPDLVSSLSSLMRTYAEEVPAIQAVKVQYLNEFRAVSADTKSASSIFNPDSRWVAPFYRSMKRSWHCHSGKYNIEDGNKRNLVNVNCDVNVPDSDANGTHEMGVSVLILAGCFFNIVGKSPRVVRLEDVEKTIESLLEESHDTEKKMLREVISAPYLMAMGAMNEN